MKWIHFSGVHDADRFEKIYENCYSAIYNYVYQMILHRENTEDVVSETFLQAMRGFSRYDAEKGSILQWLCGIAHNRTMDFFRSRGAKVALSLETLSEQGDFPEDTRDGWRMEDAPQWEVWEILRRLRVQERELLGLRYSLGLSNREIASKLGITEQAVVGRFHRVLAKCREIAKGLSAEK